MLFRFRHKRNDKGNAIAKSTKGGEKKKKKGEKKKKKEKKKGESGRAGLLSARLGVELCVTAK